MFDKANAPPEPMLHVHCQQVIHQRIFISQIKINEQSILTNCNHQYQTEHPYQSLVHYFSIKKNICAPSTIETLIYM